MKPEPIKVWMMDSYDGQPVEVDALPADEKGEYYLVFLNGWLTVWSGQTYTTRDALLKRQLEDAKQSLAWAQKRVKKYERLLAETA